MGRCATGLGSAGERGGRMSAAGGSSREMLLRVGEDVWGVRDEKKDWRRAERSGLSLSELVRPLSVL